MVAEARGVTMNNDDACVPLWVSELCSVGVRYREGTRSVIDLVHASSPDTRDQPAFVAVVAAHLRRHPELIDAWGAYSDDKRTGTGPYFRVGDQSEVGTYSNGAEDVRIHEDRAQACADFLWREVKHLQSSPFWPAGDK
jgi:hypothetical protein